MKICKLQLSSDVAPSVRVLSNAIFCIKALLLWKMWKFFYIRRFEWQSIWIDILRTRPVSLKNVIFAPESPDILWSHNLQALQLQNRFQADYHIENHFLKSKAEEMQHLKWKVYFFCLQMRKQLATCL